MKKRINYFLFFFIILALIVLIAGCLNANVVSERHEKYEDTAGYIVDKKYEDKEKVHLHAGFKAYINNQPIDFSAKEYQLKARSVHVEDGIGEVIHVHKKGMTIGDFFETLGIKFNKTCIIVPNKESFCSNDKNGNKKKALFFYVNGLKNNEFENYEIKDLDIILISYGSGDNIKNQLESTANLKYEYIIFKNVTKQ